jgi:hypothetical protein
MRGFGSPVCRRASSSSEPSSSSLDRYLQNVPLVLDGRALGIPVSFLAGAKKLFSGGSSSSLRQDLTSLVSTADHRPVEFSHWVLGQVFYVSSA